MRMQTLKPRVQALKRMSNVADVTVERMPGRTAQDRNARFLRRNPLCAACLKPSPKWPNGRFTAAEEVDHIVPLWKGGPEDESNLQGLCAGKRDPTLNCHGDKSRLEEAERRAGHYTLK